MQFCKRVADDQVPAAVAPTSTSQPTPTVTSTTTSSETPFVPEIICPTDPVTEKPTNNGCFWATKPTDVIVKDSPNLPSGFDKLLRCTWQDNGSKGVNNAGPGYEDYTCQ